LTLPSGLLASRPSWSGRPFMKGITLSRCEADYSRRRAPAEHLHVLQLFLIHPEIVAEFMDNSEADLFADFCLT